MSFRFRFGRPQKFAALLLLFFLAEAVFVIGRTPLHESDYRYALCGREMWEKPVPTPGYFTTCGNMQGDGSLAYRMAGLPLSVYVTALRVNDWVEAKRLGVKYEADPVGGSVYDLRHQIVGTKYLLCLPFALSAALLGGALWWVSRRLFGNVAGAFALGLYTVTPAVLRMATSPNNEVLTALGLFGVVYTGIGIAHAMYGPQRKWRPRIVLYTALLGLTACSHVLAAALGAVFSVAYMLWVAERRRTAVLPIVIAASMGALFLVFASYTFRLSIFQYVFSGGAGRFTLSLAGASEFFRNPQQLAATAAVAVALVLFAVERRSRYFGNLVPLLTALLLLPVVTTQVSSNPILWAYPFVLTFVAGVFADALETRHRKLFLGILAMTLAAQAILCATWMVAG